MPYHNINNGIGFTSSPLSKRRSPATAVKTKTKQQTTSSATSLLQQRDEGEIIMTTTPTSVVASPLPPPSPPNEWPTIPAAVSTRRRRSHKDEDDTFEQRRRRIALQSLSAHYGQHLLRRCEEDRHGLQRVAVSRSRSGNITVSHNSRGSCLWLWHIGLSADSGCLMLVVKLAAAAKDSSGNHQVHEACEHCLLPSTPSTSSGSNSSSCRNSTEEPQYCPHTRQPLLPTVFV